MFLPLGSIYKIARKSSPAMSNRMLENVGRNKLLYYLLIFLAGKLFSPSLSQLPLVQPSLQLDQTDTQLLAAILHSSIRLGFSSLKSTLQVLLAKVYSLCRQKIYGLFNSYFYARENTLPSSTCSTVGIYQIYLLLLYETGRF